MNQNIGQMAAVTLMAHLHPIVQFFYDKLTLNAINLLDCLILCLVNGFWHIDPHIIFQIIVNKEVQRCQITWSRLIPWGITLNMFYISSLHAKILTIMAWSLSCELNISKIRKYTLCISLHAHSDDFLVENMIFFLQHLTSFLANLLSMLVIREKKGLFFIIFGFNERIALQMFYHSFAISFLQLLKKNYVIVIMK